VCGLLLSVCVRVSQLVRPLFAGATQLCLVLWASHEAAWCARNLPDSQFVGCTRQW
jgi:hypothetical protein